MAPLGPGSERTALHRALPPVVAGLERIAAPVDPFAIALRVVIRSIPSCLPDREQEPRKRALRDA